MQRKHKISSLRDTRKFINIKSKSKKSPHFYNKNSIESAIQNDEIDDFISHLKTLEINLQTDNKLKSKNKTFFELAAESGSPKCFKFLWRCGQRITEKVVKYAVVGGNKEIIYICKDEVDPNFGEYINIAAKYCHIHVIDWILANYPYCVPLDIHICCESGCIEGVYFCISKGVNINQKNRSGWTPLFIATKNNMTHVASLLIANGASANAINCRWTSLHMAAFNGNEDICRMLISNGASVDVTDDMGRTAMHFAAKKNRKNIIALLCHYGCNVNSKDNDGFTPLHLACKYGHKDTVIALLEKNALMNEPTNKGLVPLHIADKYRHTEIYDYLIKKGANKLIGKDTSPYGDMVVEDDVTEEVNHKDGGEFVFRSGPPVKVPEYLKVIHKQPCNRPDVKNQKLETVSSKPVKATLTINHKRSCSSSNREQTSTARKLEHNTNKLETQISKYESKPVRSLPVSDVKENTQSKSKPLHFTPKRSNKPLYCTPPQVLESEKVKILNCGPNSPLFQSSKPDVEQVINNTQDQTNVDRKFASPEPVKQTFYTTKSGFSLEVGE